MQGSDEILNLIAKDSKDAFNVLYNEYWKEMYKSAYNILKDHADSMDIVQEIFIWVWEHRKELVIRTSVRAYLMAAVKFKVANCIRNGKFRQDFFGQIAAIQLTSLPGTTEELLEVKELEACIRQAVELLPGKCKAVYELSRNRQLSHQEIAAELDISIKTVENHMTIALRRLRGILTRMFIFLLFIGTYKP